MESFFENIVFSLREVFSTSPELVIIVGAGGITAFMLSMYFLVFRKKPEKAEEVVTQLGEKDSYILSEHKEEDVSSDSLQPKAQMYSVDEFLDEREGEEFEEVREDIEIKQEEVPREELRLEEIKEEIEPQGTEETKQGLFERLRAGLSRTQAGLLGRLDEILSLRKEIDSDLWDEFEETLVMADLGVGTTMKLREAIESRLAKKSLRDPLAIKMALKEEIFSMLKKAEGKALSLDVKPFVIMVVGVNGVGKTTTIGKLAFKLTKEGKKVMIAAADTFRAAAIEQLEVWAKRVGSDFLKGQSGVDPSAVAFDAVKASLARGTDVLIIDTAGRLHTKTNLMEELKKIRRVVGRELEGAPHEILLVLDATTGQNAIQQAKMFKEAIDVTGIVLTKLDGTAKGGVIVAIADELNIPVKFIGIGERLEDLREFRAEEFVEALFLTGKETLH